MTKTLTAGLKLFVAFILCLSLGASKVFAQEAQAPVKNQKCTVSLKSQGQYDYANCDNKNKGVLYINDIQLVGDFLYPEYQINQFFANWAMRKTLAEMGIRLPSYLSVDRIHDIAVQVSSLYRSFGLAFNTVTLKAQKVEDGIIKLSVANGRLSDVQIYNNSIYTTKQFTEPFSPLVGKTLYSPSIKNVMSGIKRFPGVQTFSYYSRGSKEGEVRLNIRVLEQVANQNFLSLDNHGVEQTGKTRLSYAHTINNPFKKAGQANMVLTASDMGDTLLGLAQYQIPNYFLDGELSFQLASSQYDIGGEFSILELQGEMVSSSITYTPWHRKEHTTKFSRLVRQMGLSYTDASVGSDLSGLESLRQETRYNKIYVTPNIPTSFSHPKWKSDLQLRIGLGRLLNTEEQGVDDHFTVVNFFGSLS